MSTTTQDPLHDDPDEKARRQQTPEEAVQESEAIVENEGGDGRKMPPLQERYGGPPDDKGAHPAD